MPLSLQELFRNLHNEDMAGRAECELSFLRENDDLSDLKSIIEDDFCDHPDSDPSWSTTSPYSRASSANLKLANKLVELLPSLVASEYDRLLSRKSVAFRYVILEHLLLQKCEPLIQFLKMAIEETDAHRRWNFLWNFTNGLNRAKLTDEVRSEMFDLLEPMSHEKQAFINQVDFPRILAQLCPERAREYFASPSALYLVNPSLESVLFQASELNSRIPSSRLYEMFEELSETDSFPSREREERLSLILKSATSQQSQDFENLFEKCLEHESKNVRRISQRGLVLLKLPHNPERMSVELVQSSNLKRLSREIKVIGFAAEFASVFDVYSPLDFAEESSPSEYRNTMKAIGVLGLKRHLGFLTDLLAEVNDDHHAFKRLSSGAKRRLVSRFEPLAKKLDFEEFSFAMDRFILAHASAFEKSAAQD